MFVSSASGTYGWGRRKYSLTVRFTLRAWLAVPTFKLSSKCRVRRSALSAELKTCTPWSNK